MSLAALLAINENLQTANLLKDQFRMIWTHEKPGWAMRCLNQWVR